MEVTCIVTIIVLEHMFWNIELAVFTYGGIGEGECAVELACLRVFIYLLVYFI